MRKIKSWKTLLVLFLATLFSVACILLGYITLCRVARKAEAEESVVWNGAVSDSLQGDGTQESPYIIASGADLAYLSAWTASESNAPIYCDLTINIDLASLPFTPIGSQESPFQGVFNGNGYAIEGLVSSLFGYVGNPDAQEITTAIIGLTVNGAIEGEENVAALAVHAAYTQVSECCNNAAVLGKNYTAGLVAYAANCDFSACRNTNTVSELPEGLDENNLPVYAEYEYQGGIAAYATDSVFTECANEGTIGGYKYSGGIVGFANCSQIQNCVNEGMYEGTPVSTSGYAGGIVGRATSSAVSDCSNLAEMMGDFCVAGIAGSISDTVITNCVNEGSIHSNNTPQTISLGAYISGIIGAAEKEHSVIFGCTNKGNVKGFQYIGGILGFADFAAKTAQTVKGADVYNSVNRGEVACINGGKQVGGIAGCLQDGEIVNCYNYGSVGTGVNTGSSQTAGVGGGIAGNIWNASVINCGNSGTVRGDFIGGIVGTTDENSSQGVKPNNAIRNCVSADTILGEDTPAERYDSSASESVWVYCTIENCFYSEGEAFYDANDADKEKPCTQTEALNSLNAYVAEHTEAEKPLSVWYIGLNVPSFTEPVYVTVTYTLEDGTVLATEQLIAGGTIAGFTPDAPEGYTFQSWKLHGRTFKPSTAVNSDITLVASFKAVQTEPDSTSDSSSASDISSASNPASDSSEASESQKTGCGVVTASGFGGGIGGAMLLLLSASAIVLLRKKKA